MARPIKNRTAEQLEAMQPKLNEQALEQAHQALTVVSEEANAISRYYGEGELFALDRAVTRLADVLRYETVHAIEAGVLLCLIKAHVPGRFHETLQILGISPRFAQARMQLAIKLKNRPSLQKLGIAKALQIMSEDDDTLDALELGGTLAGMQLDEIDRMSVRELKDTLRRRDDEKETLETKLAERDVRIDKLLGRSKRTGVEDRGREIYVEALKDLNAAAAAINDLRGDMKLLDEHYAEHRLTVDSEIHADLAEKIERLQATLGEIGDEFGS